MDWPKLLAFLQATHPDQVSALGIEPEGPKRTQFLHRLQGEITKRGVIDVLRRGIKHGPTSIKCFFGVPTPGNIRAEANHAELFKQFSDNPSFKKWCYFPRETAE